VTTVDLPTPAVRDGYGHARMPRRNAAPDPGRIDRVPYGRFRNVYLYISEACQLRCEHCYMGERLDRAMKMPLSQIVEWLTTWRRMGGSKVTILGGEPTLHPYFTEAVRLVGRLGYEQVITTTNAQEPALRKFRRMAPEDFAYVQVSLDGGSARTHDAIRGPGTFDAAVATIRELARRGFDTRVICTVNKANRDDALRLL
jgi:MoaA/NifB/PqqE/SkfB family radical SAM enzyme